MARVFRRSPAVRGREGDLQWSTDLHQCIRVRSDNRLGSEEDGLRIALATLTVGRLDASRRLFGRSETVPVS